MNYGNICLMTEKHTKVINEIISTLKDLAIIYIVSTNEENSIIMRVWGYAVIIMRMTGTGLACIISTNIQSWPKV